MQLTKFANINAALATAACALVGVNAQAEESKDWQFDTAILYYGETDRVTAVEGVVNAQKSFGDQKILNAKLVIDTLTGASATGAVSQPNAQTFTRPSGGGEYTIGANEVVLDDTFRDTRVQLNSQWSQPLANKDNVTAGIHFSKEYDYLSVAVNGGWSRNFNRNNTTLSLGLSYAFDQISPEGGIPIGRSEMALKKDYVSNELFKQAFNATRRDSDSEDKNTLDVVLGVTQVINRNWLVQANVGFSQVDGYLSDPFKVVSRVDNNGYTMANYYELRPDSRQKFNTFVQSKYFYDGKVIDLSYRFANDDWGIQSHTVESRLRIPLSSTSYLTPHLRFYQQSEADFYRVFINQDTPLPEYMSADYRIGDLSAYTLGLKYGRTLPSGNELSVRFEYYKQTANDIGVEKVGVLADQELYPEVDAVILQFGYSF